MKRLEKVSRSIISVLTLAVFSVVAVVVTAAADGEEVCLVDAPDGTSVEVPCCVITDDASHLSEDCEEVAEAIDSAGVEGVRRALTSQIRGLVADVLRRNPGLPVNAFRVTPLEPIELVALCCDECNPNSNIDCQIYQCVIAYSDGTCPDAAYSRWLCTDIFSVPIGGSCQPID